MISTLFLNLGAALYRGLLSVLPQSHIPQGMIDALDYFVSALYKWGALFPVTALLQALAVFIAFEVGVFTFRLAQWTYHQLWGSK